ncbi:hypothetical protein ILP92_04400 [Maribius pontilimi]|uniref:Uncharacterized protein n=1 Tax=Palleronia pontilimi TaxID=1964209 RepID=A0A934M903_9RHOB|nr:hypothetical protein [Palleronia pontilimi]MBJ3761987.1 hypothetical protein [Palleronia pontilimi]
MRTATKAALLLGFLVLGGVYLSSRFAPAAGPGAQAFKTCRAAMTSQCLLDLGVEVAMIRAVAPTYSPAVQGLVETGRIDDAADILSRIWAAEGIAPDAIPAKIDRYLASHRIAAAIRSGLSVAAAVVQTPGVWTGRQIETAAIYLRQSSVGGALTPDQAADFAAVLSAFGGETPRARASNLVAAAEMMAEAGDRDGALAYLDRLREAAGATEQGTNDALARLLGPELLLRYFPTDRPYGKAPKYLQSARVTHDAPRAEAWLDRAFTIYATDGPWPDSSHLLRVVRQAAALGYDDRAFDLARRMDRLARTNGGPFPVFPHIHAAEALQAAGAPEPEIRDSIGLALADFPESGNTAVGFGLVGGVYTWGGSGIGRQAHYDLARILIALGDLNAATGLMEGIDAPYQAWQDALPEDVPLAALPVLLAAAEQALDPEQHLRLRALVASRFARNAPDAAQRDWIIATVEDVLARDTMGTREGRAAYGLVILTANSLERPDLAARAARRLGNGALSNRDYSDLLEAGVALAKVGP